MNNIQLILTPKKTYAEDFQTNQFRFSYVYKVNNTTYEQLHSYILCRDFLGDALYSMESKKDFLIYGFSWKHTSKFQKDKTRFVIQFPSKQGVETLKENLHILNKIEKANRFFQTKIIDVTESCIIIEGSKKWMDRLWTISLYSYLLKAFSINSNFNLLTGKEKSYYEQTKLQLAELLTSNNISKWIKKTNFVISNDTDNYSIHFNNGFVSLCKKSELWED